MAIMKTPVNPQAPIHKHEDNDTLGNFAVS